MTGQELYEAWCKALQTVAPVKMVFLPWDSQPPFVRGLYAEQAEFYTNHPPSFESWLARWNKVGVTFNIVGEAAAKELTQNWFGYFPQPTSTAESSKGDVWTFKASGLKATVLDVSGSKVKLRLNGMETDWMEESELALSAKRETK